jgi:Na+-translocating ferredoxin:NAD+ oxidoreductase subunit D
MKTPNLQTENSDNKIRLTVSSSPHIRSTESISHIMWHVVLALMPAAVFGIINFGYHALIVIILSISSAVVTEAVAQRLMHRKITVSDGSAFLTGLLLAMCLPPAVPWYIPVLGSAVGIGIAKHAMGGLGSNVFNPAHIGRAFLLASYPVAMTTFSASRLTHLNDVFHSGANAVSSATVDAVSSATPLGMLKHEGFSSLVSHFGGKADLYTTMFMGNHGGSIGETSTLLLLLGGIYLIIRKYIKWQPPLVMIATVGLFAWIFGGHGLFNGDPLFHCMAGGLIIGAFFMITDPVTIPITLKGQIIFALGVGLITILIRLVGGYPEGVCYAILLMNATTPIIDRYIYPKKFGSQR